MKNVSRFTMRKRKIALTTFNFQRECIRILIISTGSKREVEAQARVRCNQKVAALHRARSFYIERLITHCAEMMRNFIICEARGKHVDIRTKIAFCDLTISFE